MWFQVENVSESYTVAEATYTLYAEIESERVLDESVTVSGLEPGGTEGWYFELTKADTEAVTTTGSGFDSFELE